MRIKAEHIITNEELYILQFVTNNNNYLNAVCVNKDGELKCVLPSHLRIIDKSYIGYK